MSAGAPVTATYDRLIEAPADAVFHAWTDPDELKGWFGPGGFQTIEADVDLRVGGRYRLVMRAPSGDLLTITGTYREIERPRRLVYTWTWAHAPSQEMEVTVAIEPVGSRRTRVVVTHAQIVDGEMGRYESGWREGIARLDRKLVTPEGG